MSCNISSRCLPPCEVTCTQPCAFSRTLKPCVMSCGDSTAMVLAPPVFVRFPGPVVYNCPQDSMVGAGIPQTSGPTTSYSSDGMGGSFGSGGMSGTGGSYGSGRFLGSGGSSGTGLSYGSWGSYGSGGSSRIGPCYTRRSYCSSRGSSLGKCGSF